jgi:hypothetical protein
MEYCGGGDLAKKIRLQKKLLKEGNKLAYVEEDKAW